MKLSMSTTGSLIAGVVLGSVVTLGVFSLWGQPSGDSQSQDAASDEKKPLYWVAPMNPDYRRDKPGKSPMGMDLIPVYAEEKGDTNAGPGTIRISPEVINNLGVRTARAERKTLHTEIQTVGYVGYDEDQLVHVHPRVEGWIEKLYVKAAGDPVKNGQPLYEIYSPELVNAQEELVLAIDRKNLRLATAAEDRLNALQIPKSAIKKLKQSLSVKQTVTFYAPQSGVVDNLNIREGFFVKPGTRIMSIGTLDQVWVEAEVFERQASGVTVGSPVTMTLDYLPGKEWRGKVDYVYPTLDEKTRTVKVRLRFDNENEVLKPNMFAQVVIHAENSEDTLLVPREAVIRTGSVNRVILALGDGRFKSIEVNVGRFDEQSAEILMGLREDELVVTSAQFLLDSESSKTSDFKRMHHGGDGEAMASSAWVEATINNLMEGHRMVNVTHKAISEWDWPEMTMDFMVSESVIFSELKQGMTLHVEVRKMADSQYEISNVHIRADETANQSMNHDGMDHNQDPGMKQEGMDFEDMDLNQEPAMDHQGMDHDGMDHNQAPGMKQEGMDFEDMDLNQEPAMDHKGMDHDGMDYNQAPGIKQEGMNHESMDHSDHNV